MVFPFIGHKQNASRESVLLESSMVLERPEDLSALVERIGSARYVLLGEASHGTHEYYTWRAHLTTKLIEEKGFSFVAVEGDWPDCYNINRYLKSYANSGADAHNVMKTFCRWPSWMWANWETVALIESLHKFNGGKPVNKKIGFYGLDLYSLWESFHTIIAYLRKEDPDSMKTALRALKCFEPYFDDEGESYARANLMVPSICEEAVLDLLTRITRNMSRYDMDPEGAINAEENAHVLVEAEKYYRTMMHPGPDAWNTRDRHMVATLERLMKHHGPNAKAIVWEHNTHIGDARATSMIDEGMINVGQLLNQEHGREGVYSIGFGSNSGEVAAGREWGDEVRIMDMPEARSGSWEHLLHSLDGKDRIVFMDAKMKKEFKVPLPHRAIGVVYGPAYEYPGNYVPSIIPERYNAFIYLDRTTAIHPIHVPSNPKLMPETFPFGI